MLDPVSRPAPTPVLERAKGRVELAVATRDGGSAIEDLAQEGCGRLLFPVRRAGDPVEAVIVNTAGGVTGGDRFDVRARLGEGADAILTTQACEKVYRSAGPSAFVRTSLSAGAGARLSWLPQETILFEGSHLDRTLEIELAGSAELVAVESILLGRQAMGETLEDARLRDRWRIRREGRLVLAEDNRVEASWLGLRQARALLGDDTRALATIVAQKADLDAMLEPVRNLLDRKEIEGGASCFEGLLVVRCRASSGLALRKSLVPILEMLTGRPLPRVWQT